MTWYQDLAPRGKTTVSINTVIPRSLAKELDEVGDWLLVNGYIKKNNPYALTKYSLEILNSSIRKQMK